MYQINQDYNFETNLVILARCRYAKIKPYNFKILK